MLGRLIKYELLATGRVFLPIYAALVVMSAVARLVLTGDLVNRGMSTFFVVLILVILFTGTWVVTLVMNIRRFWNNLLGREGYLMHVLPVHSWEHVLSKLICAMAWILLSGVVTLLSLFLLLGVHTMFQSPQWQSLTQLWNGMWSELQRNDSAVSMVLFLVESGITALLNMAGAIMSAYAAMCVGQLANRHRVWASIGAYFGIEIVESLITRLLLGGPIRRYFGGDGYVFWNYGGQTQITGPSVYLTQLNHQLLSSLLLSLVFCVILFFASQWLLSKKLNLQ